MFFSFFLVHLCKVLQKCDLGHRYASVICMMGTHHLFHPVPVHFRVIWHVSIPQVTVLGPNLETRLCNHYLSLSSLCMSVRAKHVTCVELVLAFVSWSRILCVLPQYGLRCFGDGAYYENQ